MQMWVVGGSLSSLARIWGECLTIYSPPALFFFFFKVEISLHKLILLFIMPVSVHSGSVSWDKCGRVFPDKLHVSSFLDRFPHYAWTAVWSAHSAFIESQVYVCLHVTCHLHFQLDDQGLLHATAVTQRWNRHHITVSTHSYLWRRFSCHSCKDSNSQPFDHESRAITHKLFQ